MTPEYVYNQFLNQSHRFPIRDVNILKAPNDNNFLNRIAITFNNLPENIRSQTKFSSFKNLSVRHFMSHAWPLSTSYWQYFCCQSSYSASFIEQYHPFWFHFILFNHSSSLYILQQELCQMFSKKIFLRKLLPKICIKMLKKMITVVQNACSVFGQLIWFSTCSSCCV